jgi:hypothetical protein
MPALPAPGELFRGLLLAAPGGAMHRKSATQRFCVFFILALLF